MSDKMLREDPHLTKFKARFDILTLHIQKHARLTFFEDFGGYQGVHTFIVDKCKSFNKVRVINKDKDLEGYNKYNGKPTNKPNEVILFQPYLVFHFHLIK